MKKNIRIVTLFLVLTLTLSGCSITDSVNSMMKNAQTNAAQSSANKTLKDNAGYSMSKSTSKALNNLVKSTNALSEAQANANKNPKGFFDKIPIVGSMLPTKHNHAQKKLATAAADQQLSQKKANTAIANDSTLKKSKAQGVKESFTKYIPYVLGAIAIIIIILLLLSKLKKKEPKKKPEEPKKVEEKKEHTGLLEVNYDSLLKDNCGKCNLNAAEVSNMFEGNTRLASDAVQYCATKGMKGDEAMEYVKKKAQHFKDYGN